MGEQIQYLQRKAKYDLQNNILPFWMRYALDNENGGFYGEIDRENLPVNRADKGCVLNARILWTFASAFNHLKNEKYLEQAVRAYHYFIQNFLDKKHGGCFWRLDYKGVAVSTKKQVYAQAFALYGLSEYFMATQDKECLEKALELYRLIEEKSFDEKNGGYFEAFARDWSELEDMRLSEKDSNEKKSMNTHLHILEAYTNLYRAWKNKDLGEKIQHLIDIFLEKIIDTSSHHLNLFFDEVWDIKSDLISFGHDIEASWLLHEAAEVIGDITRKKKIDDKIPLMLNAIMNEGADADGSLFYEATPLRLLDGDKHWWVQGEGVVGYLNAYEITRNEIYLNAAYQLWKYIEEYIIDEEYGDWHARVSQKGQHYKEDQKVSMWKCPYHNSRTCLEVMRRCERLLSQGNP